MTPYISGATRQSFEGRVCDPVASTWRLANEEPIECGDCSMSSTVVSAEVILTSPSRNFVTLKVTTDDGVVGWGDATLNGRELAVAS